MAKDATGEYVESFLRRQLLATEAALRATLELEKPLIPEVLSGLHRQIEGLIATSAELSLALIDVQKLRDKR